MGTDQEWQSILRRPLFADAERGASASLAHLTDIFVERQHLLWKVCHAWLQDLLANTLSLHVLKCMPCVQYVSTNGKMQRRERENMHKPYLRRR